MNIGLHELIEYTDWERQKWYDFLMAHGEQVLEISAGSNGDGRFSKVGDLVGHIFAAEKRYIERLAGRTLTDLASIPNNSIEKLFEFGRNSRVDLKEFIAAFPAARWDELNDFKVLDYSVKATPRKIITHVLIHEIRHWTQIATLLRLSGFVDDFHDFLASPVMGGDWKRDLRRASAQS